MGFLNSVPDRLSWLQPLAAAARKHRGKCKRSGPLPSFWSISSPILASPIIFEPAAATNREQNRLELEKGNARRLVPSEPVLGFRRGGDSASKQHISRWRRLHAESRSRGDGGRVVAFARRGDPGARGRPGHPHQAAPRRGAAPEGGARAGEELRRGLRLRARLHLQADAQEGGGLLQGPHPGDLRHRLRRLRARRLRRRLRAHRLRQPAPGAQLERRLPQEVPERVPQALLNPHVVAMPFPL